MKVSPRLLLAFLVALAVAIWAVVWLYGERRDAIAALERDREASALELAGLQVAHEAELRGQLELTQRRLAAMGIRSTPVAVVSGTTGPVKVGGAGSSPSSPQAARVPAPADSSTAGAGPADTEVKPPLTCVLHEGDSAEIRVAATGVKTEHGNYVVEGSADAYALGPERHLFGGPLRLDVQIPSSQPPASKQGMGLGATMIATRHGTMYGPVFAAPPLRVWRYQLELSFGSAFGNGEWSAAGTAIARRSR